MDQLSVQMRELEGAFVVELAGELDLAGASAFTEAVRKVGETAVLVLDLSRLTFMDSTGLRLVLETDAQVRGRGGRCVVVPGTGAVHRLIGQTLLESRLDLVDQIGDLA